jgi:hypothetical protein
MLILEVSELQMIGNFTLGQKNLLQRVLNLNKFLTSIAQRFIQDRNLRNTVMSMSLMELLLLIQIKFSLRQLYSELPHQRF